MSRYFQQSKSLLAAALILANFVALSLPQYASPVWARSRFDKATAEPAEENFKQGMKLIQQDNWEAAIDSFQQAIYFSRNQYHPKAHHMLGLCYKATRNYGKAISELLLHLKQTVEPAPDARIDLAECYINIKDFDKARRQIEDSFRENQSHKGAHRQRYAQGMLYEAMGDISQAHQFYMTSIEQKNLYTEAWMGKARTEVKLKLWNDAISTYRKVLEKSALLRNIDYHELYYNMGTCFIQRGDHQGALDHWRLALESKPDSVDAHLALGRMLDDEKHISSAIKEYQAALGAMPKDAPQRSKVQQRLLYLEQKLAPRDTPVRIKPTPQMRMESEAPPTNIVDPLNNAPVPKDSGF